MQFQSIITLSLILIFTWSCEKEGDTIVDEPPVVKMDTLDYTQVIRTSDNFFGITNLYSKNGFYDTDTTMQITSVKVLHFTGPEIKKTATINLTVTIPLPYPYTYILQMPLARVSATGECIIIADKGHYLFKAGEMSKVAKTKNDQIYLDTLAMDKIITGQTIKIAPEYHLDMTSFWRLELESKVFWEIGNNPTREQISNAITETLDLFRENAITFSMQVIDKNNQERTIDNSLEIDYTNDTMVKIKASYRSNFVAPEYMLNDQESRITSWKKSESERFVLLLGH